MLEIKELSELAKDDFRIVALVQGESGAGKTTFGSTFPNPIFLDCDDNLQGLIKSNARSIRLCDVPEPMFIQESEAAIQMCIADKWCQTIVLDGVSTYADMLMINVQIKSNSIGKSPTQHDYLTQMTKIRKMVYDLKKSNKNVVVTCHINIERSEITGRWRGLPLVTGKLAQRIGGLFQEVYHIYTDVKEGKSIFKLKSIGDDIFSAKSLIILDEFKNEIINPSYSKIIRFSIYAGFLDKKGEEKDEKNTSS